MHLKQSTASQSVTIGPFVDSTDAVTLESGLTIANTDIRLSANGGNIAAKNSGGGTYDEAGMYSITLDATDTATVGRLQLICNMSGALPVYHEFEVLEENVYDAIYGASAGLGTDVAAILVDTAEIGAAGAGLTALATQASVNTIDGIVDAILVDTGTTLDTKLDDMAGAGFSTSTDSLEAIRNRGDAAWTGSAITSDSGTAQAGSASTITLQSGASATNDIYNGQVIYISSGTGASQSRAIGDYVGSTKVATVITNWAVNPDATSVYEIYPDEITEVTPAPTAAENADAVWDENTAGHTNAGTFGEQCKNDIDAILTDTGDMQPKLGTPAADLSADVAAVKVDTAATLVDTGTTLPTTLSNIEGKVDTVDSNVDAVLVDTGTTLPATLGTPAGADMSADIAAVKSDSAAILTDTGTTLDAALAAVDSNVDAIKTATDQLTFTVTGEVDANVESVNATTVIGVGTSGNKWRA